MIYRTFLIVTVLMICLSESLVFAQGRGSGPGYGRGAGSMSSPHDAGRKGWFADLNLSSEQMIKIRDLRKERMKANMETRMDLMQKRKELAKLLEVGAPDEKIKEKTAQMLEAQRKISELHSSMLIEVNKILTPEQRAKFSQHMMDLP